MLNCLIFVALPALVDHRAFAYHQYFPFIVNYTFNWEKHYGDVWCWSKWCLITQCTIKSYRPVDKSNTITQNNLCYALSKWKAGWTFENKKNWFLWYTPCQFWIVQYNHTLNFFILYNPNISRTNITQDKTKKAKALYRPWTRKRHPCLDLTGEVLDVFALSFVLFYQIFNSY